MVLFVGVRVAAADPVSFELRLDVSLGQKPQIRITATQKVTDVRVELDRADGKHFAVRAPAIATGAAVTLSIGDGAAGKTSYKGTLSAQVVGDKARWTEDVTNETTVRAPVHAGYDAAHLDLDKHVLQFTLTRPAGSAQLSVLGEDGTEIGTGAETYHQEAVGTWLSITWKQPAATRVLMLKLHAISAEGATTDVELVPWSVSIDHEDINFATDSAMIEHGEEGKLATSIDKIAEVVKRSERFVKMKLYVAGHTDTVGSSAKNRKLSLDRAKAIAAYFHSKGVTLPIMYAGYGEDVLKVKTPDETASSANRRADYVIGPAAAPPPFAGPYLKARAQWIELH